MQSRLSSLRAPSINPAVALLAIALAIALAAPGPAWAQEPVPSFDLLKVRLKPGDTVWVTDAQGREVKGRIALLRPDSITLAGSESRPIPASDVRAIVERQPDSLKNGALVGMGVGMALGVLGIVAAATDDDCEGCVVSAAVGFIVLSSAGAGIGALIDLAIPVGPKVVVYQAGAAPGTVGSSPVRLSIAPLVSLKRQGLAVTIAF